MSEASLTTPLPTWLSLSDEGVTVTLKYPFNFNGVMTDKVVMRAPSVKDMTAAKMAGGGDYEKMEMSMFCSLLTATEAELLSMKYRDYKRLTVGYFHMVEADDV